MNRPKLTQTISNLELLAQGRILEERTFMFDVDRVKAFQKLAAKQFKEPNLALRELVSNSLDSYVGTNKRQKVEITLSDAYFEVIDWGMGFTEDKIECLRTLGQSDKRGERGYIGRFGIGFASIFHPDLRVKRVIGDTKVNGNYERLEFVVQSTGVTLKRYDLIGTPSFSTRIRADFQALPYDQVHNMTKTLREEAKYMNADIKLNGENISGKEIFQQERKYMLNFKGEITGRICFFNNNDDEERETREHVTILSHNVYVGSQYCEFFHRTRDLNLPSFFGFLNYDNLNVITSRNDFRKDEKYEAFAGEVRKQVRKKFRELCKEISRTKDSKLREILMNSFYGSERQFRKYIPKNIKDSCAKALADAPIFTAINQRGAFSLRQIYEIAKKQGYLLCAADEGAIELMEMQGYTAPIIRTPSYSPLSLKRIKTFQLDKLYTADGQVNEKFYQELIKRGIINPDKLKTEIKTASPKTMPENERIFLSGLREILKSPRVKKILADSGLDTNYTINLADISPVGVAACYNSGNIFVNRRNPLSAQYIMERGGDTAIFYLPILAHELSHNVLTRHDNPFYAMADGLSSKLALAVAEDIAEQSSK